MTRAPSRYQEDIYGEVEWGMGNLFVDAVAGSGKTTTLEGICARINPRRLRYTIFLAFSKEIQLELQRRLPREVWVRTFHSIAQYCMRTAVQPTSGDNWLQDKKYSWIIRDLLDKKGCYPEGSDARAAMDEALYTAIRFARLTLVNLDSDIEFEAMCRHYDIEIDLCPGLRELTAQVLQIGADQVRERIDFTDMIYLPVRLNIPMRKFGLLLVDEAQDLSACQRELVRRMMYEDSRVFFVGDPRQAIFGFAGAGVDSVEKIAEEFQCQMMPLSVCYRCPSSHLDLARDIVAHIENRDDAPVGAVGYTNYDGVFSLVNPKRGDLVMCRTNAPLVELAFELIAAGIPATIKGRDLFDQLVSMAKQVMKTPGATWDTFQQALVGYLNRIATAMAKKEGTDMQIQAIHDRGAALSTIVARAQAMDHRISTIDGLEKFIERIYGAEHGCVVLTSVHKAKGLEADHTFILGPELMPHRMAQSPWAVAQEHNLRYVALTRGKQSLTFVSLKPKIS